MFHVVDSVVTASVIANQRSSSRMINRTLRRMGAVCCLADLCLLPLWTISEWSFSDAESRSLRLPPKGNA